MNSYTETEFFVGAIPYQMYVKYYRPSQDKNSVPIVLLHGGFHTSACFVKTPDNRQGWAPYLAELGLKTYIVDWPGRGRSGFVPDLAVMSYQQVINGTVALLQQIGSAVILTHSMSGVVGWQTAQTHPQLVKAIVGIAPGPPANLLPVITKDSHEAVPEDHPRIQSRENTQKYFTNSDTFPQEAFENYFCSLVAESARISNERRNVEGRGLYIRDPKLLFDIPICVITGDQDPRHPREADAETAKYFRGDFIWLPEVGLPGHGHMQMLEHGNLAIADLFTNWLKSKGLTS
ncbi:MAG: alpha/beta fold hydrolase [Stigonema ocellatum SAG 48.90 = DSM 106950]|nr:alpha/beta fold hydrolase [Stigonema ocellatum SAG 48.90 = DSM 106950]